MFVTPDRCHNMHDDCESGDQVKNGDDFLRGLMPKLLGSKAYADGGAVFVTWDESEDGEWPIGMMVFSPHARAGHVSGTAFTHSSLLRTLQEIFAVGPLIRDAENA
ncbi:MAG: hypothetical protein KIT84_19805 [Labilithrix sp.]|nr:hypothetical protein [Labilithrix sp.]MCW5813283.1 hypothetical protein [Labilithrix sp.]